MPLNTYGPKAPFKAKVKSVETITGPKATGETCHIIIETEGKIPFWEGQSYGVIPPVRRRPSRFACSHSPGRHRERAWNALSLTYRMPPLCSLLCECTCLEACT